MKSVGKKDSRVGKSFIQQSFGEVFHTAADMLLNSDEMTIEMMIDSLFSYGEMHGKHLQLKFEGHSLDHSSASSLYPDWTSTTRQNRSAADARGVSPGNALPATRKYVKKGAVALEAPTRNTPLAEPQPVQLLPERRKYRTQAVIAEEARVQAQQRAAARRAAASPAPLSRRSQAQTVSTPTAGAESSTQTHRHQSQQATAPPTVSLLPKRKAAEVELALQDTKYIGVSGVGMGGSGGGELCGFAATVTVCGRAVKLGAHPTAEQAAMAHDRALIRANGPSFCRRSELNFDVSQYAHDPLERFAYFDSTLKRQLFGSSWMGPRPCDFGYLITSGSPANGALFVSSSNEDSGGLEAEEPEPYFSSRYKTEQRRLSASSSQQQTGEEDEDEEAVSAAGVGRRGKRKSKGHGWSAVSATRSKKQRGDISSSGSDGDEEITPVKDDFADSEEDEKREEQGEVEQGEEPMEVSSSAATAEAVGPQLGQVVAVLSLRSGEAAQRGVVLGGRSFGGWIKVAFAPQEVQHVRGTVVASLPAVSSSGSGKSRKASRTAGAVGAKGKLVAVVAPADYSPEDWRLIEVLQRLGLLSPADTPQQQVPIVPISSSSSNIGLGIQLPEQASYDSAVSASADAMVAPEACEQAQAVTLDTQPSEPQPAAALLGASEAPLVGDEAEHQLAEAEMEMEPCDAAQESATQEEAQQKPLESLLSAPLQVTQDTVQSHESSSSSSSDEAAEPPSCQEAAALVVANMHAPRALRSGAVPVPWRRPRDRKATKSSSSAPQASDTASVAAAVFPAAESAEIPLVKQPAPESEPQVAASSASVTASLGTPADNCSSTAEVEMIEALSLAPDGEEALEVPAASGGASPRLTRMEEAKHHALKLKGVAANKRQVESAALVTSSASAASSSEVHTGTTSTADGKLTQSSTRPIAPITKKKSTVAERMQRLAAASQAAKERRERERTDDSEVLALAAEQEQQRVAKRSRAADKGESPAKTAELAAVGVSAGESRAAVPVDASVAPLEGVTSVEVDEVAPVVQTARTSTPAAKTNKKGKKAIVSSQVSAHSAAVEPAEVIDVAMESAELQVLAASVSTATTTTALLAEEPIKAAAHAAETIVEQLPVSVATTNSSSKGSSSSKKKAAGRLQRERDGDRSPRSPLSPVSEITSASADSPATGSSSSILVAANVAADPVAEAVDNSSSGDVAVAVEGTLRSDGGALPATSEPAVAAAAVSTAVEQPDAVAAAASSVPPPPPAGSVVLFAGSQWAEAAAEKLPPGVRRVLVEELARVSLVLGQKEVIICGLDELLRATEKHQEALAAVRSSILEVAVAQLGRLVDPQQVSSSTPLVEVWPSSAQCEAYVCVVPAIPATSGASQQSPVLLGPFDGALEAALVREVLVLRARHEFAQMQSMLALLEASPSAGMFPASSSRSFALQPPPHAANFSQQEWAAINGLCTLISSFAAKHCKVLL